MKTVKEFLDKYKDYTIKDEEALLKLLEKPRPKTVWDLQIGDTYWTLLATGKILEMVWTDCYADYERRANHRCYLTKEDAEFARKQEKIIAEMERLGGTKNMMSLGEFDDCKYYIRYDHAINEVCIYNLCCTQDVSNIYFASKELAQKAIDEIGEDRIKKYLFYVEENNNE